MSCSTGSMTARASSGSSSRISSVDPLMSANSAVTVLRSPLTASDVGAESLRRTLLSLGGAGAAFGSGSRIAAPHSPQNFSPGSMGAPHFGHEATSGVPQLVQNLRPSRLSLPHFEQRILPHSGCDNFGPLQLCRLLGRVEALSCIG